MTDRTVPADPREAAVRLFHERRGHHYRGGVDADMAKRTCEKQDDLYGCRVLMDTATAALNDAGYTLAARQDEPSPALTLDEIERAIGEDGEPISTGVAKNRVRAWVRAKERAAKFAATGELDVPRGDGDTDV